MESPEEVSIWVFHCLRECVILLLAPSNSVFSRDVTAAMLVSLNNGAAAMFVYPTNPPGIELCYHANVLLFRWKNKVTDHLSENTLCLVGSCMFLFPCS